MSVPAPIKCECPCGCGQFGSLRQKVMKDGLRHVSRCPCKRCTAPRFKQRARKRENVLARATGGERSYASGVLSGADTTSAVVECEETAQESLVRGIRRWWLGVGVQRKLARLYARQTGVPRAFVVSWDGHPQLAVMTFADFEILCQGALSNA